jgi:hypothetical protein
MAISESPAMIRCADRLACSAGAALAGAAAGGAAGWVPQADMAKSAVKSALRKVHLQIFFRIVTIGEFLL